MKSKDQRIFLEALDELEREKGIIKEELLEAVETALLAAYKKNYGEKDNAEITINRETGEVKVFSRRTVVEDVVKPEEEISLEDARSLKRRVKLGDVIDVEINAEGFKRNAIQNAKQIVVQKVRECEKKNIFNKFKQIEKMIVAATVRKTDEKGNLYIDINGLEAIVPAKELSEADRFHQGDRIRVYVGSVEESTKYTKSFLSRKAEELLRGLLELEIPEIEDGIIEIKNIAREAGSRTKVAVYSEVANIDTIGACIGQKGARIKNIVDELNGEKIDIVIWKPEVEEFVSAVLSPAVVESVEILEDGTAKVLVAPSQLSLAIGKNGQNARLAARITGMRVDIKVTDKESKEEKVGTDE